MIQSPIHLAAERRAAMVAVALGAALLAMKFVAYARTGSTAVLSDALESIVNVVASAFALHAVSLAGKPADAEHPYGHGKIEFLSAGFEGGMILIASIVLAVRVATDFYHGPNVNASDAVGLWLIAIAAVVNGAMGLYLVRLGRQRHSMTLEADGRHLLSDVVTSVGVLVALLGVRLTGWRWLDPAAGLLITAYIATVAISLIRKSAAGLMDAQDVEDGRQLSTILSAHLGAAGKSPRICSYHKLRHRHSGRQHWVDFHIMIPPWWSVAKGHATASAIEYELEQALGDANATAHIEPCADPTCQLCAADRTNV